MTRVARINGNASKSNRATGPRPVDEPSAAELTAIEREWPLIAAELAVVDAEVAIAAAGDAVTKLDWRRLRHANRQVLSTAAALSADRRLGGEAA